MHTFSGQLAYPARGYNHIESPSVNQRFAEGLLFTADVFTDVFMQNSQKEGEEVFTSPPLLDVARLLK